MADDIQQLQTLIDEFVKERDWGPQHSPKNLAMSIAIEAAELMEHFQWLSTEEADNICIISSKVKTEVAYEMADVMIYLLSLASTIGIDLKQAVLEKMAINSKRFPPKV